MDRIWAGKLEFFPRAPTTAPNQRRLVISSLALPATAVCDFNHPVKCVELHTAASHARLPITPKYPVTLASCTSVQASTGSTTGLNRVFQPLAIPPVLPM